MKSINVNFLFVLTNFIMIPAVMEYYSKYTVGIGILLFIWLGFIAGINYLLQLGFGFFRPKINKLLLLGIIYLLTYLLLNLILASLVAEKLSFTGKLVYLYTEVGMFRYLTIPYIFSCIITLAATATFKKKLRLKF